MSATKLSQKIASSKDLQRCPFPIPYGWYVIDYSCNVIAGTLKRVQAFDQEWLLFRGENNSVGMTDPYCPHLGADIGFGGQVSGDNLRCPFHHWEFDHNGWCKEIPYANKMPRLCSQQPVLRTLPTLERYGMIWCWYHPDAIEPTFDVPTIPEMLDNSYIEPRHNEWEIGTCLQEIGENSIDTPHLKFLHGAPEIPSGGGEINGQIFSFSIGDNYITGEIHGPGVQLVTHTVNGVSMLMFSTPLPLTREKTLTRMHFTFPDFPEYSNERKTAEHIYQHSMGEADGEESAGFEAVDLIVWNNKKYREKPILCDGDGPIALWRRYFKQFYVK